MDDTAFDRKLYCWYFLLQFFQTKINSLYFFLLQFLNFSVGFESWKWERRRRISGHCGLLLTPLRTHQTPQAFGRARLCCRIWLSGKGFYSLLQQSSSSETGFYDDSLDNLCFCSTRASIFIRAWFNVRCIVCYSCEFYHSSVFRLVQLRTLKKQ